MHPVGGLLRLAGGGEDGARVFERLEPGGNISRMVGPRAMGNAEIGQQEPAENLPHLS
jgi:hypothetical protein